MDFKAIFENFDDFIFTFIKEDLWRLVLAAIVVIVSILFKSIISKCIFKIIKKRCKEKNQLFIDAIVSVIDSPIKLFIITSGLYICTFIIRFNPSILILYSKAIQSLLLLCIYLLLYNAAGYVKNIISRVTEKTNTKMDDLASVYLCNALKIVVVIFGVLSILQQWIGNISGLLAGLSIGGVAIALAAQDTAANLFGSITVMLDHPFEIGDYIEVGSNIGTVEKMGLRSTKIRMPDQAIIFVPNSLLSKESIKNWTKLDRLRVNFNISFTYSTKPEKIQECVDMIKTMLKSRDDVHNEDMFVGLIAFARGSLDINVRYFTKTSIPVESNMISHTVNLSIMKIISELGISIAFS